ncbi:unnamed protein product [Urochloa humidicola]
MRTPPPVPRRHSSLSPALVCLASVAPCRGWAKDKRGEAASGLRGRAKLRRACAGEEGRKGEGVKERCRRSSEEPGMRARFIKLEVDSSTELAQGSVGELHEPIHGLRARHGTIPARSVAALS